MTTVAGQFDSENDDGNNNILKPKEMKNIKLLCHNRCMLTARSHKVKTKTIINLIKIQAVCHARIKQNKSEIKM